MYYIALRMLIGDTTKFLALVFGLTFSTTLIVQQGSIFTGLMRRTAANVERLPQVDIWVMHPATRYYEERKAIESTALQRVRGVPGVEWAERLFLGGSTAKLPNGTYAAATIIGVDRFSKLGVPPEFEAGSVEGIEQPDGVLWDNQNVSIYKNVAVGQVLEINDRRAVVTGLPMGPKSFSSGPIIYTTYERALQYAPGERNRLTFVLVKVKPGADPKVVAARIEETTSLGAKTSSEFFWATISYWFKNTAIPINIGITALLGLIVGIAIAGQTFFTFVVENTKHFGALKAMGVNNAKLVRMVLLQALVVGLLGWGLGTGLAALSGANAGPRAVLAFMITPHLLALSFVLTILTVLFAAMISIIRVLRIEPAIVFR